MKKLAIFSVSLSIATVLFILTALVCFGFGYLSQKDGDEAVPEAKTASQSDSSDRDTLSVNVIYSDGQNQFASRLYLDPDSKNCWGETLDHKNFDNYTQKYIITDKDFFVKTADRYGGLVYNEDNGVASLLTGNQAVSVLTPERFTEFCVQVASKAVDGGLFELFLFLADNTQNNLSYPDFYDSIQP